MIRYLREFQIVLTISDLQASTLQPILDQLGVPAVREEIIRVQSAHVAMHLSRDGLMILKSRLVLTYTTDRFPITHLIREDRINEVTTLIDQNLPPDLH
jgi:hypothetical protein